MASSCRPDPRGVWTPRKVQWLRDNGRHGGGHRFTAAEDSVAFNRCSLNFSTIHYPDQPEKPLVSTTAVSMIVHPRHPLVPSMHMHVSWTENRGGMRYWRVMADLNPSNPREEDTAAFKGALREAAGAVYEEGAKQGDMYFHIPALERHRGVTHFYLECYRTEDELKDRALARAVGMAAIRAYSGIINAAVNFPVTPGEQRKQLEYHTLYLFQVLTLDRGTTSGLLAQGQNDLGIMGSLPERVDGTLLASWTSKVPKVQVPLLEAICGVIGAGEVPVTPEKKLRVAEALRAFYKENKEALQLQARGTVLPPTVANHSSKG
eukprot:Hpha_TRINITY_DN9638_c0_g1::TRINITY_DN9638_c0_g1_i2::g.184549::m.184549/K00228/CPOX, hemF; coproporphyrinogen III oxidase